MIVGDEDIDGDVDGKVEMGFAPFPCFPCFPRFRADMNLDVAVKLFSDVDTDLDSDVDVDFGASTDDEIVTAISLVKPEDVSEGMSESSSDGVSVDTDKLSRS